MRYPKFWSFTGVALTALLSVSCVDKLANNTGSAPLYVFDGSSHAVLAWADLAVLYDASAAGTADRTITSNAKIGSGFTLGQGGMALDSSRQNLYLVAQTTKKVVRISRVGSQVGELTSTADIISFTLDDTGTDSQIWVIPLDAVADGVTVATTAGSGSIQAKLIGNTTLNPGTHDTGATGVTTNSAGVTFAYFHGGDTLFQGGLTSNTAFAGQDRIRKGGSSGFDLWSNVILGQSGNATTLLAQFGALAYDTSADKLYAACQNGTPTPLVAFDALQFSASGPVEAAPTFAFGGPADLRVIAHAGQKDWLVGASASGNLLWIWKGPSTGVDTHLSLPLAGVQIQGLALDGSN